MPRGLFLMATLIMLLAGCGSNRSDSLSSSQNLPSAGTSAPTQRQATTPPTSTPQAVASPSTAPAPSQATPSSTDHAFELLWTIHGKVLSAQEIETCLQAGPCITQHDPESAQAQAIARLYHLLADQERYPGRVYVRLLRGDRIVMEGYGTAWLDQFLISGFDANRYYWAINPCATNTRLLIDARTGQAAGPTHELVICTPVEPPIRIDSDTIRRLNTTNDP